MSIVIGKEIMTSLHSCFSIAINAAFLIAYTLRLDFGILGGTPVSQVVTAREVGNARSLGDNCDRRGPIPYFLYHGGRKFLVLNNSDVYFKKAVRSMVIHGLPEYVISAYIVEFVGKLSHWE